MNFFQEKHISFRIAVGFFAAILISVALYFVLYKLAPTADGRNGIQIIAQGHFNNFQERLCVLYMLTAETVCVFLIPALILLYCIFLKPGDVLFSSRYDHSFEKKIWIFFLVIFIITANLPGINLLSQINTDGLLSILGEDSQSWQNYLRLERLTEELLSPDMLIIDILCMALVPAICEEVFFRGFLQTTAILIFKNRHGAVILIAVIFSILHGDIFNFIPRFALGVFLGYLFLYSRHIIVPILAHALHNTWVVVCSTHQQLFPTDLDTIGTTENLFVHGIGSVLILTGATIYLAKKSPLSQ